jgi:glycosyltransferase involved in cell wall biosynthesis
MTGATPPRLRILGTRGVPAAHGGFETFAERLALDLVAHGWEVVVYGQEFGRGPLRHDTWQGVQRVQVPVALRGPAAAVAFDARAIAHAARSRDPCLTLGYNTALLCAWLRLHGVPNVMNMDGLEWQRAKWGAAARAWLWLNERAACRIADHLVADHPAIQRRLLGLGVPPQRLSMLAYGADPAVDEPVAALHALGLQPGRYLLVVARAEPENSLLEIVQGFVSEPGDMPLVLVGAYDGDRDCPRCVKAAADHRVHFVGAIYDQARLRALRCHALAYAHGHRVGGTNPSLVEALGAGNAVIAHDNCFNRWVADGAALYFDDAAGFASAWRRLRDDGALVALLRAAARQRFDAAFGWERVLAGYRQLLQRFAARPVRLPAAALDDAPPAA